MVLSITLEEAATGVAKGVAIPAGNLATIVTAAAPSRGTNHWECPTCHGAGEVRTPACAPSSATRSASAPAPPAAAAAPWWKKPAPSAAAKAASTAAASRRSRSSPASTPARACAFPAPANWEPTAAPPGDLYIVMQVRDHPLFQRDGNDLHRTVSIPFPLAVMGGPSTVGTLIDGDVSFDIPEGTAPARPSARQRQGHAPSARIQPRRFVSARHRRRPQRQRSVRRAAELVKQLAEENGRRYRRKGLFDKLFGNKENRRQKEKREKK